MAVYDTVLRKGGTNGGGVNVGKIIVFLLRLAFFVLSLHIVDQDDFEKPVDFSDLHNVTFSHRTTRDGKHHIAVTADLIDYSP